MLRSWLTADPPKKEPAERTDAMETPAASQRPNKYRLRKKRRAQKSSSETDGVNVSQIVSDSSTTAAETRKRARGTRTTRGKTGSAAASVSSAESRRRSKRAQSFASQLNPQETSEVLADMVYDSVADVGVEKRARVVDENDLDASEKIVVAPDSVREADMDVATSTEVDPHQTTARVMCIETSAGHPACKRSVTTRWIKTAKRHINGTESQARSVRANSGTPEKVYRKLTQQEKEDAVSDSGVPRAAVLPPHVERKRRAKERSDALEKDVANGNEVELPEFRTVSERYAIGFMKHLEVGQNIDISSNGKYTFLTTESALPKEAVAVLDAAAQPAQPFGADPGAANASAPRPKSTVPDSKSSGAVRFSSENNVPIMAQRSHDISRRDANNTFQRSLGDASEALASGDSMYDRLMNFDPRSTAGIAKQSPLMEPFSRVLSFTPQPYLFSAATDDARSDMYSPEERPRVETDSGDPRRNQPYDERNSRDIEREVLSAFSHKDFYPIVPRISFELEQSFLREPFVGEPPCINGAECAGMTDLRDEIPPMVLVAFYPLAEIVNNFIESHRAARDQFLSSDVRNKAASAEFDQAAEQHQRTCTTLSQHTGGSVSHKPTETRSSTLKPSKCVLCHRAFALKFAMHLNALNATTPKDYAFVQYCNITDTHGEYDISSCVFNSNARYVGLPGPIALHNTHLYRRITVKANGQTVNGLKQLHQRVGMDNTLHF